MITRTKSKEKSLLLIARQGSLAVASKKAAIAIAIAIAARRIRSRISTVRRNLLPMTAVALAHREAPISAVPLLYYQTNRALKYRTARVVHQ